VQSDFESSEFGTADKTSQEDFEAIMKYTESLLSDLDMNPDFEPEFGQGSDCSFGRPRREGNRDFREWGGLSPSHCIH
jgi:hypothetical protein